MADILAAAREAVGTATRDFIVRDERAKFSEATSAEFVIRFYNDEGEQLAEATSTGDPMPVVSAARELAESLYVDFAITVANRIITEGYGDDIESAAADARDAINRLALGVEG